MILSFSARYKRFLRFCQCPHNVWGCRRACSLNQSHQWFCNQKEKLPCKPVWGGWSGGELQPIVARCSGEASPLSVFSIRATIEHALSNFFVSGTCSLDFFLSAQRGKRIQGFFGKAKYYFYDVR